jgi:hypothetical protein
MNMDNQAKAFTVDEEGTRRAKQEMGEWFSDYMLNHGYHPENSLRAQAHDQKRLPIDHPLLSFEDYHSPYRKLVNAIL